MTDPMTIVRLNEEIERRADMQVQPLASRLDALNSWTAAGFGTFKVCLSMDICWETKSSIYH